MCSDCSIVSAVGMRCPECAGQKRGVAAGLNRAVTPGGSPVLTFFLTATIIAIFVLEAFAATGALPGVGARTIEEDGVLFGPWVADGEWWRLVSSAFLHANLIHIGFNALLLWILGSALETHAGTLRMGLVYLGAVLWGSAGALLLDPDVFTLGASGGVFGLLLSAFILEKARGVQLFQPGFLGPLLLINLGFSFLPGVSLGGHFGGLVGGALVTGVFILLGSRTMSGAPVRAAALAGATAVALAGGVIAVLVA
jgi:membrane associated rhomboid family serine protease